MSETYERFSATANQIAGAAVAAQEIGNDVLWANRYLAVHGEPTGTLDGALLRTIQDGFRAVLPSAQSRFFVLADLCLKTGIELNRCAWIYYDTEKRNYERLNANLLFPESIDAHGPEAPATGPARPYPGPVRHGGARRIELPHPETPDEDVREVVAEAAGWLGDVDKTIEMLTGWSPIAQVLEPLGGNWNELERLGNAYRVAGEAVETSGENLAAVVGTLDPHWDGQAARAFTDYAARIVDALRWEGPVGRVIEETCHLVADKIREGIVTAVRSLREMLEEEVAFDDGVQKLKFALKKVPFAGTAVQIVTLARIVRDTMEFVDDVVARIRELTDALTMFLDALASPANALQERVEQDLAPLTEAYERTGHRAAVAVDLAGVADVSGPTNRPTEAYSVGGDPWADAP
ncbi:hypothetical protein QYS60_17635 [Rhodococcus sp. GXMU-t2271]|uniref:WXG100 family type VII secretion target n=1 Tax=Rhodococcus sp. GXMU-t2271 TaxID=3059079 RepID=UPI00352AA1CD